MDNTKPCKHKLKPAQDLLTAIRWQCEKCGWWTDEFKKAIPPFGVDWIIPSDQRIVKLEGL